MSLVEFPQALLSLKPDVKVICVNLNTSKMVLVSFSGRNKGLAWRLKKNY